MWKVILLISMLFFHIVDDYYLQGILASMKQKKWWLDNAPDELYRHDYVIALLEHAFSWTVMTHIPIVIYRVAYQLETPACPFLFLFIFSWLLHAWVDDQKANKHAINLITEQCIHIAQVVFVWFWCVSV